MRMSPNEILSRDQDHSQIGSSKLAGVHTKVLSGQSGKRSLLLDFVVRNGAHNDSSALSP
jgi:hypothetical protein